MSSEEASAPKSPEDMIRDKIAELSQREANRRRAIDLAFDQVSQASTPQEQQISLDNLERMMGVYSEFQEDTGEIFPPEG
jgi:hypothetical protein